MSETQTIATISATETVTGLVAAGETFYQSITGREMSDNGQKISDGVTKLLDGSLPAVSKWVGFDLLGVIGGATETLDGLAKTVTSARTKSARDMAGTGAVSAAS